MKIHGPVMVLLLLAAIVTVFFVTWVTVGFFAAVGVTTVVTVMVFPGGFFSHVCDLYVRIRDKNKAAHEIDPTVPFYEEDDIVKVRSIGGNEWVQWAFVRFDSEHKMVIERPEFKLGKEANRYGLTDASLKVAYYIANKKHAIHYEMWESRWPKAKGGGIVVDFRLAETENEAAQRRHEEYLEKLGDSEESSSTSNSNEAYQSFLNEFRTALEEEANHNNGESRIRQQ